MSDKDPKLQSFLDSILMQESSGGKADTTEKNYAGALGPMQVTESTFNGLKNNGVIPADWSHSNPEHSKEAGVRLATDLYNKYGGDVKKASAAYYSGPKAVLADGTIRDFRDPNNPNAPSTLQYAESVFSRVDQGDEMYSGSLFNEGKSTKTYDEYKSDRLATILSMADNPEDIFNLDKKGSALSIADDNNKRLEVSNRRNVRIVEKAKDQYAKGEIGLDGLEGAVQYAMIKQQERDDFAVEKEAVDKLSVFSEQNPSWASLKLVHKDIVDQIVENNKKDQLIQSYIDRMQIINAESNPFYEFLDDTKEILLSVFLDDVISGLRTQDWGSAESLREKGRAIKDLPIDQIPAALDEYSSELLRKSSLVAVDNEDAYADLVTSFGTSQDVMDQNNAIIVESLLSIVAGPSVKSVKNLLKNNGATTQVAEEISKVVEGGKSNVIQSTEEAVSESVVLKLTGDDGIGQAVLDHLENNQKLLDDVKSLTQELRLTDSELATAASKKLNSLKRIYKGDSIVAAKPSYNYDKGVFELGIFFGKKDGTGFSSEAAAKGFLTKNNMEGEVIPTSQGFKVKQVYTVGESLSDEGFIKMPIIGRVKRILQSPKAYVDELTGNIGTNSAFNEARLTGIVKDVYNKTIRNLKSKEADELNDILNLGLEEEKWYSPQELSNMFTDRFGKPASDAQVVAYYSARQISDLGHFIQNRAIYQEQSAKGLDTISLGFVSFKNKEFTGNLLVDPIQWRKSAHNARIYDAGKKQIIKGTPEELDRLEKAGYVFIKPSDASWTVDEFGGGASFIATKSTKQVSVKPLDTSPLNYVQGGRIQYTSPFYIGQVVSGKFEDGTRYLKAPRVFRSANTTKEAQDWIAKHNAANAVLRSYNDGMIPGEEASKLIGELTGDDVISYAAKVEDEGWDILTDFQMKADRGDFPVDYDQQELVRMFDKDSLEARFGEKKRSRLSSRGDTRLLDVNENRSEIFDFLSSLNSSADQAIKMGAYNEFKINAVNRFATTFGKYIDNADTLSPYEIATKGVVKESVKTQEPEKYQQLLAHQFYIKSIMRVKSDWDKSIENALTNLAISIEGKGKFADKTAAYIHKSGKNPIETIRGINYDLNLGMFNPAQLFMQANSVLTAIGLSPKHGLSAVKDSGFMRMALIAGDEATIKELSERAAKSGLTDGKSLAQSVYQFKKLGFNDFGTNLAMMDVQNSLGATSSRGMANIAKVREAGRFFFQEGERWGRLTAYNIAKRKYIEKFSADPFTKQGDTWIRAETDRIMLSPNSDNNQFFTKGIYSIPTQFWSYMGKMADVMLTGSNGRYSTSERLSLVGTQALFYGSAGVPILDWALDNYEKSSGKTFDPEVAKFMHNGLIDATLYSISDGELDTNFSGSASIGGFFDQMYKNLAENPVASVLGGATGGNLVGAWKSMQATANMYGIWYNPTPEGVSKTALAGLSSLVSSMDRVSQAYIAYNTGVWYDRYGRKQAEITKSEAIASVVGFNPQKPSDVYSMLSNNKEARAKYVDDVSIALTGLTDKYDRAETESERQYILSLINALSTMSKQTGYWEEAAFKFNRGQTTKSFYDSLQTQQQQALFNGREGIDTYFLTREQREELSKGNK